MGCDPTLRPKKNLSSIWLLTPGEIKEAFGLVYYTVLCGGHRLVFLVPLMLLQTANPASLAQGSLPCIVGFSQGLRDDVDCLVDCDAPPVFIC